MSKKSCPHFIVNPRYEITPWTYGIIRPRSLVFYEMSFYAKNGHEFLDIQFNNRNMLYGPAIFAGRTELNRGKDQLIMTGAMYHRRDRN